MNSTTSAPGASSRTPDTPMVSVIIPTYNRAVVVQKAIASVLQQTHSSLELIVVDDASTDDTELVVRRIADRRVRYLRLPVNGRAAAALNAGLDSAQYDYVAFLDSDDVWSPHKLERQLDTVRETAKRTDNWISYTQLIEDNGVERHIRPTRGKRPGEPMANYLFCSDGVTQTSTLLLPLALAKRTRFRPDGHFDWDFCLRLDASDTEFLFHEEALTTCDNSFRDDRSSSSNASARSLRWLALHSQLVSPKARRAFCARHLTRPLRHEGKRGVALRYIAVAVATNSIPVRAGLEQVVIALITDRIHQVLWRVRRALTSAIHCPIVPVGRRGARTRH